MTENNLIAEERDSRYKELLIRGQLVKLCAACDGIGQVHPDQYKREEAQNRTKPMRPCALCEGQRSFYV